MLEHTGALFTYLIARKDEETDRIAVKGINSLQCLMKDFLKHIGNLRDDAAEAESEDIFEMYCILGTNQQTEAFISQIKRVQHKIYDCILSDSDFDCRAFILRNLAEQEQKVVFPEYAAWLVAYHTFCCNRLYALQQFQFSRADGDLEVCCLGLGVEYEDRRVSWMQNAVKVWLDYEAPQIYGKQVIINSFWLNDLKGRRIIGVMPQNEGNDFFLIVEGGRKVPLNVGPAAYMNEQIGYRDTNLFSINDINSILSNPLYSYGNDCQPFEDWQKVFQYAIAVLNVEWTVEDMEKTYQLFMDFMVKQICECREVPSILSKEKFFEAYLIMIVNMRAYLCCEEEAVISSDWLRLMKNRFVYLNNIYALLEQYYPKEICELKQTKTFERREFRHLLDASEEGTSYQKGIMWESVAAYMLERIAGLKVNGKRLRVARQEIDLCCINVSAAEELWKLGALILVECKNWNRKADVSTIRNIGQIMYIKGTTTTLLFSKSGITGEAEAEILQLALRGMHILCITKSDLLNIAEKQDFYELLIRKWSGLEQIIENNLGLLG